MVEKNINILLIEDNEGDARFVQEILAESQTTKFEITHTKTLSEAEMYLVKSDFDVVLTDLSLPDSQGLDTVMRLLRETFTVAVVVLTGLNDESIGMQAVHIGAQDYLVKGQIDVKLLTRVMRYAIERHKSEKEKEKLIIGLREALHNVKTLKGLLPICAWCKKIRDDKGYWDQVEVYIQHHSDAAFSHGLCPECAEREMVKLDKKKS